MRRRERQDSRESDARGLAASDYVDIGGEGLESTGPSKMLIDEPPRLEVGRETEDREGLALKRGSR